MADLRRLRPRGVRDDRPGDAHAVRAAVAREPSRPGGAGLELSSWTVLYYITFTLIAAFLLLNILIGVVINSLEEAREIEAKRDQDERRRRALETPDPADDREVAIVDRVAALRTALEELEREVGSTPARARAGPRR